MLVKVKGLINANDSPTGQALHSGDWADIKNRNLLRKWLADGTVEVPPFLTGQAATAIFGDGCGVLIRVAPGVKISRQLFDAFSPDLKVKQQSKAELPFKHTLLWTPAFPLVKAQLILGFSLVSVERKGYDAWEMAALLAGTGLLACGVGSTHERQATKQIVGDNRIPVYNTHALWVKRTPLTTKIIAAWQANMDGGVGEQHAFLRALYGTPVKFCSLPFGWPA